MEVTYTFLLTAFIMGDSLAVELPALDRATLVRIQVPQPHFNKTKLGFLRQSPTIQCRPRI